MIPAAAPSVAETPAAAWVVFGVVVVLMLAVDLLWFEKRPHARGLREAAVWSVVWVGLALLFSSGVWYWRGGEAGLQFLTTYVLEKSLSVDNLFIFLVVFRFFGVRDRYQPRVLFWGILGAIVMRGLLIAAGTTLIQQFEWLMFVFGAVVLYTGVHLLFSAHESYEPNKTLAFRLTRRLVPMTADYREEHFFVREGGRLLATPLLLVLVIVETTDLVFAVDSIPACLGVSQDLFIVFTSNIFAILGLRALYFLLAGLMGGLRFLKPALGIMLVFIGVKMVVDEVASHGWFPEPWNARLSLSTGTSLLVIAGTLAVCIVLSLAFPAPAAPPEEKPAGTGPGQPPPPGTP